MYHTDQRLTILLFHTGQPNALCANLSGWPLHFLTLSVTQGHSLSIYCTQCCRCVNSFPVFYNGSTRDTADAAAASIRAEESRSEAPPRKMRGGQGLSGLSWPLAGSRWDPP